MKAMSIADDIVPVGEFKAQISRMLKRLEDGGGPLVITRDGRAAGVVLAPAEYDRLRYRERFLESVFAGSSDAEAGRTMDSDLLRARLAERRVAPDPV